jgi:hypothetical protein
MDDVSVKLYKYMCDEVVGSEKVVDYRRQFFNVFDDVYNYRQDKNWHHISSGSKAEGLNLPGSDSYIRSRVKPGIALSKSETK